MQTLSFTKMNGAGNDFVMLDNRSGEYTLGREQIARICDRHRGIGADGVLLVEPPPPATEVDWRMRYYNADGGEAEMCGNGSRCFARFATRLEAKSKAGIDQLSFLTGAGVIRARLNGELVHLEMSHPTEGSDLGGLTLDDGTELAHAYFLNTGVPHVVVSVADVETVDVPPIGRLIRYHDRFAPRGTNANFIEAVDENTIILRTYERGVEGETLACGTGATAAALIHAERSGVLGTGSIAVRVRSGDTLQIGFERTGAFAFSNVTLGGPAEFVFAGEIVL